MQFPEHTSTPLPFTKSTEPLKVGEECHIMEMADQKHRSLPTSHHKCTRLLNWVALRPHLR